MCSVMLRGLLIFCVLCTASLLVTVKGHPGKMRILPGLTFYHTDDNIGGTQSLNEEDRTLLNTVLKIVSRPEMQQVLNDLQNTIQNPPSKAQGSGDSQVSPRGLNGPTGPVGPAGPVGQSLDLSPPIGGSSNGVSGMPIATINVYPGYPGAQAMNDGSMRRMYQPRTSDGPQTLDTSADGYDEDNANDASPILDPSYGLTRKFFLGDSMNELKDAVLQHNGDDAYANQNYPIANDNYFDGSSSYHQMLPALDRRSLGKLQQKDDYSTTQMEDGQRRLMQYEKPSPVNHYSSMLFPTH